MQPLTLTYRLPNGMLGMPMPSNASINMPPDSCDASRCAVRPSGSPVSTRTSGSDAYSDESSSDDHSSSDTTSVDSLPSPRALRARAADASGVPFQTTSRHHIVAVEETPVCGVRSMTSAAGENLYLGTNFVARGCVDQWLTALEERMKRSLRFQLELALDRLQVR